MSYKDALVSNMVAGTGGGYGRGSVVPKFDDSDFDGWLIFLKAFLMKFDRADVAFIEPMPMRDMDQDGEEYPFDDPVEESAYQKKREKWVDRNTTAYSYLVEACIPHNTAKLVVKSYSGTIAAVLLKRLKDRFKNVQQTVKQSEITKFNTLVMEPGETCCTFVDRVKEQAQKLENMGEKVSNTNLLTRLKEGVHKVHPLLASNLYIQGCDDVKVVEDVIRGYDNTPMAKQNQPEGGKSFDKANVAAEIPGKNGSQKRCRLCHKRGHLANDCYANQGRKSHNRGIGKPTHNVVKRCYICNSSNHLQAECPKNKTANRQERSSAKSKGVQMIRRRILKEDGNGTEQHKSTTIRNGNTAGMRGVKIRV